MNCFIHSHGLKSHGQIEEKKNFNLYIAHLKVANWYQIRELIETKKGKLTEAYYLMKRYKKCQRSIGDEQIVDQFNVYDTAS